MFEWLWSVFSHPSVIVGRDGAAPMIVAAAILIAITIAFMASLGRRIMRYSPLLAALTGGGLVPALMLAAAIALPFGSPSHAASTDASGMLLAAAIVLSICAVPITLATSVAYVVLRRRALARRTSAS